MDDVGWLVLTICFLMGSALFFSLNNFALKIASRVKLQDIFKESNKENVLEGIIENMEKLNHENAFIARQAQRLLQERTASGMLEAGTVLKALQEGFDVNRSRSERLQSLWAMKVCDLVNQNDLLQESAAVTKGTRNCFRNSTYSVISRVFPACGPSNS